MSNPLDYIRQDREAKAQKKAKAEKERAQNERQKSQYFETLASQHGEVVLRILEALQEIAYPQMSIKTYSFEECAKTSLSYSPRWAIGEDREMCECGFYEAVSVTLQMGQIGAPTSFLCHRQGRGTSRARLSEQSLIAALKKLHPIGS